MTQVPVEMVRHAAVDLRRAVVVDSRLVRALGVVVESVVDVVADVQVEPAVPVVVDERRGDPEPRRAGQPAPGGRVGEPPVTLVAVQPRRAEVRQVEVGQAVVVDVPHGHAQTVAVGVDVACAGDVGEAQHRAAVGAGGQIVAEEASAGRRAAGRRRYERVGRGRVRAEHPALHQVRVEVAVGVVVEQRHPGGGGSPDSRSGRTRR